MDSQHWTEEYIELIRERRKLNGTPGYTDIDQLMKLTGREYPSEVYDEDQTQRD